MFNIIKKLYTRKLKKDGGKYNIKKLYTRKLRKYHKNKKK